jgi:hypothetical protein
MADLFGTLPPELALEQQRLNRQQKMAEMLLAQGAQPQAAGQMVSGRYVPNSFFQNLQGPVNMMLGAYMANKGDKASLDLAKQLREAQTKMGEQYFEAMSPTQTELAGPTPTGAPLTTVNQPDYRKAFTIATDPYAPKWLQAQAAEMLKPQKVGEGEKVIRFNPATGKNEVVAEGGEKFRAPLQTDTGTFIEYRDPRDPTKVLARVPKTQMPTAGQVVEREDGTFLVDTRTGQAKPVVGPQGQPLTGGKPLTEVQSNAVAFGMRAIEANKLATDLENKGFTNTGAVRTAVAGTMGQTPIVGGRLEQGVRSAFNVLPEVLGGPSAEQQQNDQARRNFISAVLRKESGAAIGVEEYANEERKYFPQLGDSKEVIKQKQDARNLAIKALEAQAGPSGKRLIEKNASPQLSPQDQEALNWANSNPTDPRSAQIKQRLGR